MEILTSLGLIQSGGSSSSGKCVVNWDILMMQKIYICSYIEALRIGYILISSTHQCSCDGLLDPFMWETLLKSTDLSYVIDSGNTL